MQQIVLSKAEGSKYRFEITFHNNIGKKILIKEITVIAHHPGAPVRCCCPPDAIFQVDDTITLLTGNGSEPSALGQFEELVRGQGSTVQATGQIYEDGCNGEAELSLKMPCSFLLPANEYSAIYVLMPENFTVIDSRYTGGRLREKPQAGSTSTLKHFDSYEFHFLSSEGKQFERRYDYQVMK